MALQLWPISTSQHFAQSVTPEPMAQYSPAVPPAGVAHFPEGLFAPGLFFAGTSQDGWLRGNVQVKLSLGGLSNVLHLTGKIPDFSTKIRSGVMTITVDGNEVLVRPEASGAFDLVVPIPPAEGTRLIKLDMTGTDMLPPPDGRLVSVHLTSISLENRINTGAR
jgi:hypothetical protein